MMIKFLARGTGSAAAAADYLTREQDQDRDPEKNPEEVKVLRGNPHQVAAVADALQFEHKYTSGVIAWAPEDNPSDEQIGRVVEEFEKTAWAGLEPDRYAWAAVQHREAGGGVHVHVLAARCDLETGKSLNIAAPGWQKTFDALRDWQNPTGSASGAPANPAKLTLSLVQKSGASHCDITLSLPLVQKIGLVMRIETFRHDFLSG